MNIKTDNYEIQRIVRKYFETLSSNTLENLKEMDKFIDIYDLKNLNQNDINNMNRFKMNNEIKLVRKILPTKSPKPGRFTTEV
jgi:hypothetical protein